MVEVYYIDVAREKRNTAGAKAPDDIAEICKRNGYHRVVMPMFPRERSKTQQKLWLMTICVYHWWKVIRILPQQCVVLYQHPQYGVRVAKKMISLIKKKRQCKFVCVIHDLESLRGGIKGVIKENIKTNIIADDVLLQQMDCLICHNEHMRDYLISRGYALSRLVCLDIFDYLSNVIRKQPQKGKTPSIAIAGNLAIGKCRYIYDICAGNHNPNLEINLYGNNYTPENGTDHMIWHGSFKPEELPEHLHGDFGLVWDGDSADTCAGNTGVYLRYNNPHKTSLYLACGMPVIVWREAAIADFILKNEVGIAVESLSGLDRIISAISDESYQKMCENAARIGQKLRDGEYFKAAMEQALKIVK